MMRIWHLNDVVSINDSLPQFHYIILHITYKEGNKVADALVKWGSSEHQLTLDTTWSEISKRDDIDTIKILIQKDEATLSTIPDWGDPAKP